MDIKCPKCQSSNPESATFCADCGTKLLSPKHIEVTETVEKPKEELTTGSTFAWSGSDTRTGVGEQDEE